jgi:hypothetical protein
LPSALPRFTIRAPQEQIDAWKAAAAGRKVNEWAVDALDLVAGRPPVERVVGPAPLPKRAKMAAGECPNVRHHRPGAFCKTCGGVA